VNRVRLLGKVIQPPVYLRLDNGVPYLRLYVGVRRPAGRADHVRVIGYHGIAEAYELFEPGKPIFVQGRFRTRKIRKAGRRVTIGEVVAAEVATAEAVITAGDGVVEGVGPGEDALAEVDPFTNNEAVFIGNLTHEPKFDLAGETPTLVLYLAVDRRAGGADYPRVVAYDDLARISYPYLRKGSKVLVVGRLRVRKDTKHNATVVETVAHNIVFLNNIDWEAGEAARREIGAE